MFTVSGVLRSCFGSVASVSHKCSRSNPSNGLIVGSVNTLLLSGSGSSSEGGDGLSSSSIPKKPLPLGGVLFLFYLASWERRDVR